MRGSINVKFFGMLQILNTLPILFLQLILERVILQFFYSTVFMEHFLHPMRHVLGEQVENQTEISLSSCNVCSSGGECDFPQASKRPTLKKWNISNISVMLGKPQSPLAMRMLMTP